MDPLSATAALGTNVGQVYGQMETNETNREIAQANNAWSAEQYAKRYQTQVADIKAAGLNPMLAYSQSPGSAPSAQVVQFQNPFQFSSAASAYADVRNAESGASRNYASAAQAEASVRQIDATVDKIKEETKNVPIEGDRLKYTIQLLAEQAAKTAQETQSQTITQKVLTQTVNKLKSETTLLDLDIEAAKLLDNIGRESKQLQPIVDIVRSLIRK